MVFAWYLYGHQCNIIQTPYYGVCMVLHWIVSLLPIAGLQQKLIKCRKKESAAVANLPTQRRFWLDNLVIKSNRDNKDSDKKRQQQQQRRQIQWKMKIRIQRKTGIRLQELDPRKNEDTTPKMDEVLKPRKDKDLFATKDEDQRSGSNERQGTESNKSKGSGLTKGKNTNPTKDLKYTNKDLIKRYALGGSSP